VTIDADEQKQTTSEVLETKNVVEQTRVVDSEIPTAKELYEEKQKMYDAMLK